MIRLQAWGDSISRIGSGAIPRGPNRAAAVQPVIMIKYKDIAFTAYAVTNIPRARKFYEKVLGLKLTRKLGPKFFEYDIGRGTLVVACAPELWPPSRKGTCATLEVADMDAAIAHMRKKRVKFAIGPLDFPTCRMFTVRDPDGNQIAFHQLKRASERKKAAGKK